MANNNFLRIRPPKKLGTFKDEVADKFGEEISRTLYDLLRELKETYGIPKGGHIIISGTTPLGWSDATVTGLTPTAPYKWIRRD